MQRILYTISFLPLTFDLKVYNLCREKHEHFSKYFSLHILSVESSYTTIFPPAVLLSDRKRRENVFVA